MLLLLAEQPMHGYQIMQAITDRTSGRWAPSPGAIYPTISQLEDEGLVSVTADSGRKLVRLTEPGRMHIESDLAAEDPFAAFESDEPGTDFRELLEQLHTAARQVARTGTDEQRTAAATILNEARRSLYLVLAGDAPRTDI